MKRLMILLGTAALCLGLLAGCTEPKPQHQPLPEPTLPSLELQPLDPWETQAPSHTLPAVDLPGTAIPGILPDPTEPAPSEAPRPTDPAPETEAGTVLPTIPAGITDPQPNLPTPGSGGQPEPSPQPASPEVLVPPSDQPADSRENLG